MGAKKQAIGICVDGTDLKIAVLSRERGTIRVEALMRDVLPGSLEEEGAQEGERAQSPEEQTEEDAFGFEEEGKEAETEEEEEEISNQGMFLGLLGKLPLKRWPFAVNMPSSKVYYHAYDEDFGLKKRGKIRKRLRDELQNSHQIELPPDAVDFLRTDDGGLLAVAHDRGLAVLDLIEGVKSFLSGPVRVALVEPNEIALMNLVRAGYPPEAHENPPSEQEVVAVVHIGEEFGRVLFMRGNRYLHFGGMVNEGKQSPRVLEALFSKILLEQDVSGLPDIDRFLLSGDCAAPDAPAFFADRFPGAEVAYLVPPELDVSGIEHDEQEIAAFAVPIGLAWKALGAKKGVFYDTDFVPERIRDRQNAYKLAWHGFLMIGLVGVAVLAFLLQWKTQTEAIRDARRTIRRLETCMVAAEAELNLRGDPDSLRGEIGRVEADIAFVDTLSRGAEKWSPMLEELALQTKSLRSVWFESFTSGGDRVMLKGRSLYKSHIPKISERLGDALLQTVSGVEMRGRHVYRFDLGVALQEDKKHNEP